MTSFASDNCSGVHPAIMDAIIAANNGHQAAYGDDIYSLKLGELIAERFGNNATCYPVFNGTGANIIALSALTPRHGAVICTKTPTSTTMRATPPSAWRVYVCCQ